MTSEQTQILTLSGDDAAAALLQLKKEIELLRKENDRLRQKVKTLESEIAALEYLDYEASIGAEMVNSEIAELRAALTKTRDELESLRNATGAK